MKVAFTVRGAVAAALAKSSVVITAGMRSTNALAGEHHTGKVFTVIIGGAYAVIPRPRFLRHNSRGEPCAVRDRPHEPFRPQRLGEKLDGIIAVDSSGSLQKPSLRIFSIKEVHCRGDRDAARVLLQERNLFVDFIRAEEIIGVDVLQKIALGLTQCRIARSGSAAILLTQDFDLGAFVAFGDRISLIY